MIRIWSPMRTRQVFALMLVLALVVLAGCGGQAKQTEPGAGSGQTTQPQEQPSGGAEPAASEPKVLKFGALLTLSGGGAILGKPEQIGVEMAVSAINERGGLKVGSDTYKVDLITYDTEAIPAKAVEFTNRLLYKDGVRFIYGARDHAELAGEVKLTDKEKAVVISGVASSPILTTGSQYGFSATDNGAIEKHSLIHLLAEKPEVLEQYGIPGDAFKKVKRIALVGRNELYVIHGLAGAKEAAEKFGFEWAGEIIFPPETTDFLPYIAKLKAMKPDAVILDTYELQLMIPPLKEMKKIGGMDWTKGEIALLGNDVMGAQFFVDAAAQEGLDMNGAYTFAVAPLTPPEKGVQFREKLIAKYGQEAAGFLVFVSEAAYDATMMVFQAIEEAGAVTDTDKVKERLLSLTYDGVRGPGQHFDDKKQQVVTEYILAIRDGKVVQTGLQYGQELLYGWAYQVYEE